MTKHKYKYSALALATLVGALVFGFTAKQIKAQTTQNPLSGLVVAIAQKFNLDQSQVQNVVDEYENTRRAEMQAEMQQMHEERLTKAVEEGKITAEQKQQILDEISKLQSEYSFGPMRDKTQEERDALRQKRQDEIEAWSSSTGIDSSYLMGGFGGRGGPQGPENRPNIDSSN